MRRSQHGVSVEDAGRQIGIPPQAVRILMRRGKLPIGIAEKLTGERYRYYIAQQLIDNYLGIEKSEERKEVNQNAE